MTELPTVNYNDDITTIAQAVDTAFKHIGFVAINYDNKLIDQTSQQLMHEFNTFCNLPLETKLKYVGHGDGQRGYTPNGTEQSAKSGGHGMDVEEWREHLFYGAQYADTHPVGRWKPLMFPDNVPIYEPGCENIERYAMTLLDNLEAMNFRLWEGIALAHGKEIGAYASLLMYGHSGVRIHRYPAFEDGIDGMILGEEVSQRGVPALKVAVLEDGVSQDKLLARAGRHKDIDWCTSLLAANSSGLYIQPRSGNAVPYTMHDGQVVVNVGEMAEHMISDYIASDHWVGLTQEMAKQPRNSIVDFHHPRYTVDIAGVREGVRLMTRLHELEYFGKEVLDKVCAQINAMPSDSEMVEELLRYERNNPKAPQLLTQYVGRGL